MTYKLRVHWPDGTVEDHIITDTYNVNSNGCLVAQKTSGHTIELGPTVDWEILGKPE